MNKKTKILFIIIGVIALVAIGIAFFSMPRTTGNVTDSQATTNGVQRAAIVVTQENFPTVAASSPIINDLPKSALIELKTTDKTYTVTKGKVVEGVPTNPDMTITLPSSYIPDLKDGLCATLKKADTNRDLDLVVHMSTLGAGFKYREMMKYKKCVAD